MIIAKPKNKLLKISILILIIGIIFGMITANGVGAENVQMLKNFVNGSMDNSDIKFSHVFVSGAKQNLSFVIFAFLGALNIYLFGLFAIFYFFKCFSLGFTLFFTVKHFSLGMSAVVVTSAVLYCVALFPIYIALFCLSYKYAVSFKQQKSASTRVPFAKYFKSCAVYCIIYSVTLAGSALGALINPLLVKLI